MTANKEDKRTETVAACTLCGGNCMGCWHSDYCNAYNDIAPYDYATVVVELKEGGDGHEE